MSKVEEFVLFYSESKKRFKDTDHVCEQGTSRRESGAYSKYVSISHRLVTQFTDMRCDFKPLFQKQLYAPSITTASPV
jgi:hypothetical protein